ncbi:MAG: uridine kinase [Acidobacteriaceae bacterium]
MSTGPTPSQQLSLRMHRPILLGIAGCSGSGKTTLARELTRELNATFFQLDFYYRDLSHLPSEERARTNFDHPDILESELLAQHVAQLAAGRTIERPTYDFATHTRLPGVTQAVTPAEFVLIEGIFALHYDSLRAHYDFSVYVEAPDDLCYQRRLARDIRERGRTPESVAQQYAATVRPMAEQFVRPSACHAALVVDGAASLDWSVEQVLDQLRLRGLLAGMALQKFP